LLLKEKEKKTIGVSIGREGRNPMLLSFPNIKVLKKLTNNNIIPSLIPAK